MTLADARDVALIVGIVVFVVESLLIGALLALVALRLLAFIDLAQTRLDDVADTAVYLASPAAAFVTGQAININGGVVM